MTRIEPYRMMLTVLVGFAVSLVYCVVGMGFIEMFDGASAVRPFFIAYAVSFKTLFTQGLIIGTALLVLRTQGVITAVIERVFKSEQLPKEYHEYRSRYVSARRSLTFAAEFAVIAFVLFLYAQFPLPPAAALVMIFACCVQYASGVYVGRKLVYAGMMLHSLLSVKVTRNLFKNRELDDINTYVHIVSTLTVIFVYLHVLGYYDGPFEYKSAVGESVRTFLILPALIATPVLLIFTFYPRTVLRKLYGCSIEVEVRKLRRALKSEALTSFEKRSYLITFDKMCREELRYSLQLTLSDLPIGITILVMILQPLLKR